MSCELFVGNLNPATRMRDLENVYGRYGKILRCDLKKNYAFIQFDNRREAEQALHKENNQKLMGSVMTVEWAKGSIGDKPFRGGGGGAPRHPRSPPRGRSFRDRSPFGGGGGRPRSPVGRNVSGPTYRSGFTPREDRFGGSGGGSRRFNGNRDYDNPRADRGAPRDRSRGGDRFNGGGSDRFNSSRGPPMDRGDRRGPSRGGDRFSERSRNEDRFSDRRDGFSERRSFGGGPRRF